MKPEAHCVVRIPWPLVLVLVLLVGAPGCLMLPTPEFNSGSARANISKKTPQQFVPGKTTRVEVVLALGEPDAVAPNECKLAYRSEKVCGLWFVGAYYSGACGAIQRDRYLVVEFDAQGVLVKLEQSAPWWGPKRPAELMSPAREPTGAMLAVTTTLEPEVMAFPAAWFANLDGYCTKGAATIMGQPGRLVFAEATLRFTANAQMANLDPSRVLRDEDAKDVSLDRFGLGRRLVVRPRTGVPQSFEILGPKGIAQDRKALQAAAAFLKAKVQVPSATPAAETTR